MKRWLWILPLVFRLANAFLVQTAFNPDEYWQSLEVAHKLVFGYGHLTWEWREGLRGYAHPLIFACLYKIMKLLSLDTADNLVLYPRLLQAVFAFIADYYTFKVAEKWFNNTVAKYAYICSIMNWFNFFCGVRTFSNSLETVLTIVAMFYFPWPEKKHSNSSFLWLFFAGFACVIRPTNAVVWAPLAIYYLFFSAEMRRWSSKLSFAFVYLIPLMVFWIGSSVALDSYMYGRPTIVIWQFLKFNVLEGNGAIYGVQPWHWYFSQGLPVMLLTQLILVAVGFYSSPKSRSILPASSVVAVMIIYSLQAHKEFRFLFPIMPVLMVFAGYGLYVLREWAYNIRTVTITEQKLKRATAASTATSSTSSKATTTKRNGASTYWGLLTFIVAVQILAGGYLSLVHQRGGLDVMAYLRDDETCRDVHLWMPCHHTPGYSHLHRNIMLRHLDCSPSSEPGYIDEADVFFNDPVKFVEREYNFAVSPPSCIVMYERLLEDNPELKAILENNKYKESARFFHTHLPLESRISSHIVVYKHNNTQ